MPFKMNSTLFLKRNNHKTAQCLSHAGIFGRLCAANGSEVDSKKAGALKGAGFLSSTGKCLEAIVKANGKVTWRAVVIRTVS